jgi:hypothetical protein
MHDKRFKKYPIANLLFESHVGKGGHHSSHGYPTNHAECHNHDHEHEPILQKFWFGFLVAFGGSLTFLVLEFFTSFRYNLTIICFLGIYAYYWFFELVHVATHDGKHWQRRFMDKMPFFPNMLDHHKIHHTIKLNMNFTLVNHWCDYLFATKYQIGVLEMCLVRFITVMVLSGFVLSFLKVV